MNIEDLSDDQFEELESDYIEDLTLGTEGDFDDEIAPELWDKSQVFEPTVTLDNLVHNQFVDEENGSEKKMAIAAMTPVIEPKQTKAEVARLIFNAYYGKPGMARKDVIKMLMSQCDMGKAYAGTFYQNESKKLKK